MVEYAYLNGEIMPIENANLNVTDLALLRGYGVFDFFKAVDGRPIYMEDHLNRFDNSTWLLGLKIPIKGVLTQANKRNNYDMCHRVSMKIKEVLQINSDMHVDQFLEKLLADYNYLATKE